MNPADANGDWSWWKRALFRFAFVFWAKFCLQIGLLWDIFGWAPWIQRWILRWPEWVLEWPTDALARYFTVRVFHLSGDAAIRHPTGSGDTAQDWVGALALLVFAVAGAALWSA